MIPENVINHAIEDYHAMNRLSEQLLDRIKEPSETRTEGWIGDMKQLFMEFVNMAKARFDFEEEGGFMVDVMQQRPTLSPVVENLQEDHQVMIQRMDEIMGQCCNKPIPDCNEVHVLCSQLREMLQFLRAHERNEIHLLQGVLTEDIGTYD